MATRHDPYFYLPRFVRLEALVQTRSQAKLRDFIVTMSGGSTPKAEEQEKYYADATTGVPFVRVQNLKVSGELSLDDVKHVNHETHHGLLVRSQVKQDDLLVKITGVGRMAVAAVPPQGFEGNINQHIARIRTKDRASSEALAAWLNTDIAEALAKRRSTGGTRPALDYPALRSIPVILDERTEREVRAAYDAYKAALKQANQKLAGIDDYLLAELGIALPPEPENTLVSRVFTAQRRELAGRLDPHFNNRANIALQKTLETVHAVRLRSLVRQVTKGETPLWRGDDYQQEGIQFLRAQNVSPDGLIGDALWIDHAVDHRMQRSRLFGGEILYTMAGTIGIACIYPAESGRANINQAIAKIVLNSEDEIFKSYLVEILNSSICRRQAGRALTVSAQPNINFEQIKSLLIPIPKDGIRLGMIVEKCKATRDKAKRLRQQAQTELEAAKRRIEGMLLGEPA